MVNLVDKLASLILSNRQDIIFQIPETERTLLPLKTWRALLCLRGPSSGLEFCIWGNAFTTRISAWCSQDWESIKNTVNTSILLFFFFLSRDR